MRKRIFLIFFWASYACVAFSFTGDSLRYLTPKDTIFLKTDLVGEKYFEHKLERKQTLFSLAKFYGLGIEELYYHNAGLKDKPVSEGVLVKIPIPGRAIVRKPKNAPIAGKFAPIIYTVSPGETIFRISKSYFNLPVDTFKKWNHLKDNNLSIGQKLHIGWLSLDGIPDTLRRLEGNPIFKKSQDLYKQYMTNLAAGQTENILRGAAYWQKGSSKKSSDFFALFRNGKPGDVLSVYNPMSKRKVFVKILGNIPEASYREDVVVVLSPQAARMLGARDARFFVEVKYLSPK